LPAGVTFVSASGGGSNIFRRGELEFGNLDEQPSYQPDLDRSGSDERFADERGKREHADGRSEFDKQCDAARGDERDAGGGCVVC